MTTTVTRQTWTFREDEGGTTAITFSQDENFVEVTGGPDCDGTTSQRSYFFWALTDRNAADPQTPGVYYRNPAYPRETVFDVYVQNPDSASYDFAQDELGAALMSNKGLLSAPEL